MKRYTTFVVELLEEFPRVIRAKLRLKMEDNGLHSNGKRHGNQRGGFQQLQPTR
jgi:hypothetical protein